MCATTARLPARIRRRPCSSIRRIVAVSIRSSILAGYAGLMQADAYAGFGKLYVANRKGGPIVEAACWAHGRRKLL